MDQLMWPRPKSSCRTCTHQSDMVYSHTSAQPIYFPHWSRFHSHFLLAWCHSLGSWPRVWWWKISFSPSSAVRQCNSWVPLSPRGLTMFWVWMWTNRPICFPSSLGFWPISFYAWVSTSRGSGWFSGTTSSGWIFQDQSRYQTIECLSSQILYFQIFQFRCCHCHQLLEIHLMVPSLKFGISKVPLLRHPKGFLTGYGVDW